MNKKSIIFFVLCVALAIGSGYWYFTTPMMYDYVEKRDRAFISQMFKDNWYWLIGEGSDFDPEHMLTYRASSKDPRHLGNQTIKVMYVGNNPVGFTAYHKKKFYKGKLHFVLINEKYRSKGYGLKIVQYAVNDLVSRGCTDISLVTRVNNHGAQKVYKRAGFVPGEIVDGFVYFHYKTAAR